MFGADRPPRHQQRLPVGAGDRVGVDDPEIHPGHPGRIRFLTGRVDRDRDLGGDVEEQPATLAQQGDRPDLLGRVRHLPGQAHPQRWPAGGGRDPHPRPSRVNVP